MRKKPTKILLLFFAISVLMFLIFKDINTLEQTLSQLRIILLFFLRKTELTLLDQIIIGSVAGLIVAFITWALTQTAKILNHLIRKATLKRRITKKGDAPFKKDITAENIIAEISSFPDDETDYINQQDFNLRDLAKKSHILIVGRTGIGKTREAAELIRVMDNPPGKALVLLGKEILSSTFNWDSNSQRNQRTVILLLDHSRNGFIMRNEDTGEDLRITETPEKFEEAFNELILFLKDTCDDLRIIMTIRMETSEWKTIESRRNQPFRTIWKDFEVYKLKNRTKSEAREYINAFESKSLKIDELAKIELANRSEGEFASIRDFLKEKKSKSKGSILLKKDVIDFTGKYPEYWNKNIYKKKIEPNPAGKAFFESLDILSQARLELYEELVFELAENILSKGRNWQIWQIDRCKKAYQNLNLELWVSKRERIFDAPSSYIEGKGDLRNYLDNLSDTLLKLSDDPLNSGQYYESLLTLSRTVGNLYNRYDLSVRLAEQATKIQPDDSRGWITLGTGYSKIKKEKEALQARQKVVELIPKNIFAWSYLATSWINLENYTEAQKAISIGEGINPYNPSLLCSSGMIALKLGNTSKAKELFKKAVKLDPKLAYGWSALGQIYIKEDNFKMGIYSFQRARKIYNQDPITWSGLGLSLKKLGYDDIAEKSFRCAIRLDHTHELPWSHLGEILLDKGRYDESLEAYQKAININSRNFQSWSGMGQVLIKVKKYKKAIKAYENAIQNGGDNFSYYLGLGIAYFRLNKIPDAVNYLIKSYEINPNNSSKHYLYKIRAKLTPVEHKKIIDKINLVFPAAEIEEKINEAIKLAEFGDKGKALAISNQLLSEYPENIEVLKGLCSSYRKIGDVNKAIDIGEKAKDLFREKNPITDDDKKSFSSVWYGLGRAYEEKGIFSKAQEAFIEAVHLNPKHERAIEALKRIKDNYNQQITKAKA